MVLWHFALWDGDFRWVCLSNKTKITFINRESYSFMVVVGFHFYGKKDQIGVKLFFTSLFLNSGDPPFPNVMASELLQHLQRENTITKPPNCSNTLYVTSSSHKQFYVKSVWFYHRLLLFLDKANYKYDSS